MSSPFPDAAAPAHTRHYGPLRARDPDLEVLLTDGLGGFALSSLAGVPTRCYSGLVVSQSPPVRRFTHLVSPLEILETGDQRHTLHALELAPGVFEGRGLEVLSGVILRDLLPERVQSVGGVRVTRRTVSPAQADAVVYLYTVDSRGPTTLTLGGYFVDRDMHHVHAEVPSLNFQAIGSETTVRGERTTRLRIHAPDAPLTSLAPQPFPQRVYYRHDAARGEPGHTRWARHCGKSGFQRAEVRWRWWCRDSPIRRPTFPIPGWPTGRRPRDGANSRHWPSKPAAWPTVWWRHWRWRRTPIWCAGATQREPA